MKSLNEMFVSIAAVGMIGLIGGWGLQQQDEDKIEIVNQDGEKVELRIGEGNGIKAGADIRVSDGKIVIVDSDGKKREIDVSGAQNIIINKSVQSSVENGEEKRKVSGRAVIVGPDGVRQEFELADGFDDMPMIGQFRGGDFKFFRGKDARPFSFSVGRTRVGKYMIGVNCRPVGDDLRAHLDLNEGVGLVIVGVADADSPAAKAKLKQHDILVYADQDELAAVDDLISAVEKAGKEDRDLTLTLLRRGKELSVDVKPVERTNLQQGGNILALPGARIDIEEFGPGVVFEPQMELPADFKKHFEEFDARMAEKIREMEQRLQERFDRLAPRADGLKDDDD